jgi:alkanesulfonate monooxygenase SsuD/methylene tetrahydromethanopterin reductase-like flavin-dependent oxidoreductase (luciferase family)
MMIFGLDVSTSSQGDPVAAALTAERLGFDFVSASDHPVGGHPTYETVTMLTWIAARTSRIAVATRVLGAPFRRPAMVAKTAESLDRLSGGRLILGLGGGHSDDELVALGGTPRTPRQKVDGLADAVRVIRGAWAGEPELTPRPERPIPIWLGTFGPRALAVTGRLADGWIPSLGHAPPESIPAMRATILAAAEEAGRAPDAVRCVYNVGVHVDEHAAERADVVTGSVARIVDRLRYFGTLGFTGFNLQPTDPAQLRLIAEEVLPQLR